jgi:hypothetical protein
VRPLVPKLVEKINFSEWTQNAAHETRFADGLLDVIEPITHNALGAYHTCNASGHLSEHIESSSDTFLGRCHRVGEMLYRLKAWVDDWYWDHPYAMLHAWRKHRDFWKDALICGTGHHLVRIPLGAAVGTNNSNAGTQVFDEVPSSACDRE